jgi:ribosomal protein L40E
MSELIKCKACNANMGVTAEKCMNCGTANPSIVELKNKQQTTYKLIAGIVIIIGLVWLMTDYFSPYKKCLREGNESGLLKPSFVEGMCKMAAYKNK